MSKRGLAIVISCALATATVFTGIAFIKTQNRDNINDDIVNVNPVVVNLATDDKDSHVTKDAKYIFLFIGDGNALAQVSAAENYLGNIEDEKPKHTKFNFTKFNSQGFVTTYSNDSFITDSAAAGTAIATGFKTNSGMISLSPNGDELTTIAEIAKLKGNKVGIVTSVPINHATPAAFYAHTKSRKKYYDIGKDMVKSDFNYFAGGDIREHDKGWTDIYSLARDAGYTIIDSKDEFNSLSYGADKIIVTSPSTSKGSLPYAIDKTSATFSLAEYTKKGIELLDNDKGFFMLVEGGQIDWACHANDAKTAIMETIEFSTAVDEALKFYSEHRDETLIVVTADHETGGMTLGFAGTGYENSYEVLKKQRVSYSKFDDKVKEYLKENKDKAKLEDLLPLIEMDFGLTMKKRKELTLSDYDIRRLEKALIESIKGKKPSKKDEAYLLYGSYEPVTITLTHLLNQKAGISWTTYSHTGTPVPIYAQGIGSSQFDGYFDNTEIFTKLKNVMSNE